VGRDTVDDRHYSIRPTDWSSLLGLPAAPDLPFFFDWISTPAFWDEFAEISRAVLRNAHGVVTRQP